MGKKKMLRRWLALGVSMCAILLVTGWTMSDAASPQVFTIGVSVPATGALATFGQSLERGAQVAQDELNKSHFLGSGATINLDIQDTQGSISTSVSQYQSFVSSSDIAAMCCTTGTEAGALRPIAISSGLPTMMMTAASKGLQAPPNFMRITYAGGVPGGLFSQTIYQAAAHWHPKTAVLEVSSDSLLNNDPNVIAVWKAALAKSKINLVGTVDTLSTDKDFSGAATTTVADKPDLVILDMQANAAPLLARALGQEGYKGHMVGTYGMTLPALYPVAGSAFDNMTMAAEYIYLFNNPTNKKFVADYEARFGAVPDFFSASAFSSLLFLAQAIKNSGLSTDRTKLAAAMNKIKTFNCPLGNLTMLGGNAYFSGKATFVAFAPGGALHIVWQQPTKKK